MERVATFSQRFSELAGKRAEDPVALEALRQAVQAVVTVDSLGQQAWELNRSSFPVLAGDESARKAVALLFRDHFESDQLAAVCDRMQYGVRVEFETFLSAALEKSPHRSVRAVACLSLARLLYSRLHMRDLVAERPPLARRYESIFGSEFVRALEEPDRATLAERVEALFEEAAGFEDVEAPFGGTVAEQAAAALFDLRHLAVGRIPPEIEGRDQDGKPFKLSDYRGSVVLLYFWSEF